MKFCIYNQSISNEYEIEKLKYKFVFTLYSFVFTI